jgi:hypothetical protein
MEENGAPSILSADIPEKRRKAAFACSIEYGSDDFAISLEKTEEMQS